MTLGDAKVFLRYMRAAVLCILVAVALAVELLVRAPAVPLPGSILYLFYGLAAADAVVAVVLRRRFAGPAAVILRSHPEDAAAMANWIKGQFVPLPMALSLGFIAVAARVLGAAPLRAAPCYLLSLAVIFTAGQDDLPA
ncbi:MAG TPA: hypothetical protein VL099_01410 [Candidatus Binatia bacterium]|nr:hypothetical protein [Candidatus Binatia bacterium]